VDNLPLVAIAEYIIEKNVILVGWLTEEETEPPCLNPVLQFG